MTRDYQAIERTWFLKGKQRLISIYGQHGGVKLIGTLNYENGENLCAEEETNDAEALLRFLQTVLAYNPSRKIVMILGNAWIHHDKRIQSFLEGNRDWLELVFLPS